MMPSRTSTFNFWMRSRSRSTMRVWMVWVLCLCAWRGPLPVIHCHAVEALSTASEFGVNWQLAEHLAVCHAHEHDTDVDLGWHIHFVMPASGSTKGSHPSPVDRSVLAEVITHDAEGIPIDVPIYSIDSQLDFAGPFTQPSLSPTVPQLIPLATPRSRPGRVTPRIYYCVAQC